MRSVALSFAFTSQQVTQRLWYWLVLIEHLVDLLGDDVLLRDNGVDQCLLGLVGEIDLEQGDVITLEPQKAMPEDGWSYGRKGDGTEGLFPAAYIEMAKFPPSFP